MHNSDVAHSTPLGEIILTFSEAGRLRRLRFARADETTAPLQPLSPEHRRLGEQIDLYFAGQAVHFDADLELNGTAFQRRVWAELLRIPFGETRTYADIAHALDLPGGARAVGSANGRNPIAIIVPCHRVVACNGLGGYTGGLHFKRRLLELEGGSPQLPLVTS